MAAFILRRLLDTVFVVFMALTAVFLMMWLAGDPVKLMAPLDATPEILDQVRENLGLNEPFHIQYVRYLARAVRGDFGMSLRQPVPAVQLVLERIPNSMMLGLAAAGLSIVIGLPLGIYSAIYRGSALDRSAMFLASLGQAVPNFWLGLVLVMLLSVRWGWLPTSGTGTWKHLVMPAVTLAAYSLARITRLTRSSMLEVLKEPFIATARSKGLSERVIVWKHALRNALVPIVTIVGLQVGTLLGGAVVTETIFAWPGLGRLIVQSIEFRDYPVVMAAVFFFAASFSILNLMVDLAYVAADPRIRFS